MNLPVRYSPSGAVISNSGGGPFTPGSGARLRLVEANSTMGGSLAVPVSPTIISPAGFLDTSAIVLTLDGPKAALKYRANLSLDVQNPTTIVEAQVVLYLDTSIDGGTTWVNQVKSMHVVVGTSSTKFARNCGVFLPLTLGSVLGVVDSPTPTTNLKLRARAGMPLGTLGDLLVNAPATSSGGSPITGLAGTIHMELEEAF